MMKVIKYLFVIMLSQSILSVQASPLTFIKNDVSLIKRPHYLETVPEKALHFYDTGSSYDQRVFGPSTRADIDEFYLPMASGNFRVKIQHKVPHLNGDLSYIGNLIFNNSDHRVIYTVGDDGGIADVFGVNTRMRFHLMPDNIWAVDLNHSSIKQTPLNNDVVGLKTFRSNNALLKPALANTMGATSTSMDLIVVDTLLLYTPNIAAEFPGSLAETLLNQEVATTNQAFVDSQVNVFLRLVGSQQVNYTRPSDFTALNDLQNALTGQATDPSLTNVSNLRNDLGADLVAMIRTHDLNEREVCGVARFPQSVPGVLINISNVGNSGGSFCIDVFTHEVGHNFGAGHQQVDGRSVGVMPYSGALIIPNKFNTIMSSIGTGDLNRNYGLNKFSNPNTICGGIACGDVFNADNSRTILDFAQTNADLRATVIAGEVTPFLPGFIDSDGDTVIDDEDSFPFDPSENADQDQDGVGDNADQFPSDPDETLDTDLDGIGNNADPDDDNDGVEDTLDALPLDDSESSDLDADGIGDNADQLDNNPDESEDFDGDGIGNRADFDDDNDGVRDFAGLDEPSNSDLFVVSSGNNNLYRFNGDTGESQGILLSVDEGGFSFRSEVRIGLSGELFVIGFSDVIRHDRIKGITDIVIDRSDLRTNFTNHLVFTNTGDLILNTGAKPNTLMRFIKAHRLPASSTSQDIDQALRGLVFKSLNELLVISRSENQILIFNLDTLQQSEVFSDTSQLNFPEHIVKDLNGKFYVSNAGSGNIIRLSSSGDFETIFVNSGSGGLNEPGCLDFGPDGSLYVCSTKTNQILRYDGQTGEFLDVFVDASSGIDKPMGMVFAGSILDDAPFDPTNDSDGDGIANQDDEFPLDPTNTPTTPPTPPPTPPASSGGGGGLNLMFMLLLILPFVVRLNKKGQRA